MRPGSHPSFHAWISDGSPEYVVLFSHPADYTPVCTTELGRVAQLMPEFRRRNVKCIALSCDSAEHHRGWIKVCAAGIGELSGWANFCDVSLMRRGAFPSSEIHARRMCARTLASLTSAFQSSPTKRVNWRINSTGGSCMVVPSVKDADLATLFPAGVEIKSVPSGKTYLRMTPQPQ
ncbi:unnamed protein product [Sphagnum balticum]